MTIKIKICGVTTVSDALLAAELGATHIGLNFYPPSPRFLAPEQALSISRALRALPGPPVLVGVFVNSSLAAIRNTMDAYALDLAQLSGDEPSAVLDELGGRAYRGYRLQPGRSFVPHVTRHAPALLLIDAHVKGLYGGTGRTADWDTAAQIARRYDVFLAGGLKPRNVAAAIRRVQPWGVDVASGVEIAPGIKDAGKMRNFIAQVHVADRLAVLA